MAELSDKEAAELGLEAPATELSDDQARSLGLEESPPAAEGPSTLDALGHGAAQGASLGFADELAGLIRTNLKPFPDDPNANPWAENQRQYREGRDEWRAKDEAASKAHPIAHTVGQFGGSLVVPLPGVGKLKGAARMAGYAGQAAAFGGANAAGSSKADLTSGDLDSYLQLAGDIGKGAAISAPLGVAGGALSDKIASKAAGALSQTREAQQKLAEKAFNSARGALGGEVSSASRTLELLEKAAKDSSLPEELSRRAAEILASEEGAALRQQVIRSSLGRAPDQLARIQNARDAMAEAGTKLTPEAIEAATAARLTPEAARRAIGGRLSTIAQRFGPGIALSALGAQAGGTPGALLGGLLGVGVGAGLGKPGTIIANALKDPAVVYNASRVAEPLIRGATQMSESEAGSLAPYLHLLNEEQK